MFSIGELSKKTGVKIPTIRYYEQMKLLEEPERSTGNQRRYTQRGLERLSFICHARALGISVADIRQLVELSEAPDKPCSKAHTIAAQHLVSVRESIKKLRRLERELKRITSIPDSGHVDQCKIIKTLADHSLCETEH